MLNDTLALPLRHVQVEQWRFSIPKYKIYFVHTRMSLFRENGGARHATESLNQRDVTLI